MKKFLTVMLAAMLGAAAAFPAMAAKELAGLGDMRWGDSVKKVSERYRAKYLEDTRSGGALYAIRFSDFRREAGIEGPLVVMGAFEKGKLVQINVPLRTDSEEEAANALYEYKAEITAEYGAPSEETEELALWKGKKTWIYARKTPEGLLVSLADASDMQKKEKSKK